MKPDELEALLAQKQDILTKLISAAAGINTALKSKDFTKALDTDAGRAELLKKLEEIEKTEGFQGALKQLGGGKTAQMVRNINESFETLIKFEKENDALASESAGFFSNGRVESYRKNSV